MSNYNVDLSELTELTESEISLLASTFKDVGARQRFRLDQEGEDLFRLKVKQISDEIAKYVINEERKIHNI